VRRDKGGSLVVWARGRRLGLEGVAQQQLAAAKQQPSSQLVVFDRLV
jgi:hypothetical protein